MSSLKTTLERLLLDGVELAIQDGKLRIRAPEGRVSGEAMEVLRRHKEELLRLLPEYRFEAPLSIGQEGLWFIQKANPESVAYNVGGALRIESSGELAPRLRRALQKLVNRHTLLRTTFVSENGGPRQIVQAFRSVDLPEVDVSQLPWPEVERTAADIIRRPFDLATEGVLRVSLLRRSATEWLLVLCIHHVAVDNWSFGIFIDELLQLYAADEKPNPLPPVAQTYQHFVAAQRELLAARKEELRSFWMKELAGAPQTLELPTDRPRPPVQTFRGGSEQRLLDAALVARLRALAQARSSTISTILLCAFQVLMHRYTGMEDFCLGSAAAGRDRPEFTEIFGYLVNFIVLRTRIAGDDPPSFLSLLDQTRHRVADALDHQDYPFQWLVSDLLSVRDPSMAPLVQAGFVHLRQHRLDENISGIFFGAGAELAGARIAWVPLAQLSSELELILEVTETASGIRIALRYNSDLFDASTIARMAGHFTQLLISITEDPARPISELPLLGPREREQLLEEWNHTGQDLGPDLCLHQLFEQQALAHPDLPALVDLCGPVPTSFTYAELNELANSLALQLAELGAGPERLVGLMLPRGASLIISLLAVHKAGGAFVVLDPELPEKRLLALLQDTQVPLLVTSSSSLAPSLQHAGTRIVPLDPLGSRRSPVGPPSSASPQDLAYVLFTSGTTSQPNGALIEHRGLVNSIRAHISLMRTGPGSSHAHLLSFNFDGALAQLYVMLCSGGTSFLLPRQGAYQGEELLEFLHRQRISHAFIPPAMLAALPFRELPALETLVVAGERCSAELVQRWSPGRRMLNLYGPTEVSILATGALCRPGPRDPAIGRPIPNLKAYVVDRWGRLAVPGAVGELWLGGVGVGRGYLNRPELTRRKFIPSPFGPGRLYRTGDRVRYRLAGSDPPELEFVGRADEQVKLRGYRVELSEIECAVRKHPGVQDAVVKLRQRPGSGTGQLLVAYVTPGSSPDTLELDHVAAWDAVAAGGTGPKPGTEGEFDLTLDLRGWKSSYTGEDIPPAEMKVWAESTVERILALQPRDVLEIGCGTGMLLSRIAGRVRSYWGTDLTRQAVEHIELLRERLPGLGHVRVSQQPAHDLGGLVAERFDTILLNSVVQYFPSGEYLLSVLRGLLGLLRPGGAIFLGDIRNLALMEAFHASVEHHRSGGRLSRKELLGRFQRALTQDNELLVHPRFFTALHAEFPQIEHVEIVPKRGSFRNELTLFRYDVTLHIGAQVPARPIDWIEAAARPSLEQIRAWLRQSDGIRVLGLRGLSNARLQHANALVSWLRGEDDRPPALAEDPHAWDPEALLALEKELPCRVSLSWASGRADGSLDVALATGAQAPRVPLDPPEVPRRWSELTSDPLLGRRYRELAAALNRELTETLPAHMVPSAIVVLPALPLTLNGKVDVQALPLPELAREEVDSGAEPRTETERVIAEVFRDVLGLPRVGIHDNFFELGGDSIISIQVVARAQSRGLTLRAALLFEHQTIARLAAAISGELPRPAEPPAASVEVPLAPAQARWLAEAPSPHACWQLQLTAPTDLDLGCLRRALDQLVLVHDALRLRFARRGASWVQECLASAGAVAITEVDLTQQRPDEQRAAMKETAEALRQGLDLSQAPLMRVAVFRLAPGQPCRLLWILPRPIVDAASWPILLSDLDSAYQQAVARRPIAPARRADSFRRWSEALRKSVSRQPFDGDHALPGPPWARDPGAADARSREYAEVEVRLAEAETSRLTQQALAPYALTIEEFVLTALGQVLLRRTGGPEIWIDAEGDGRGEPIDGVDPSRCVGCLAAPFPLRLRLSDSDAGEALVAVKEQLRAVPHHGLGYGLLHERTEGQAPARGARPEVLFRYQPPLCGTDSGRVLRPEAPGLVEVAGEGPAHALRVTASLVGAELVIRIGYCPGAMDAAEADRLADRLQVALSTLIEHCAAPGAGAWTPSDFPLAGLGRDELRALCVRLGVRGRTTIEAIHPLLPLQQGLLFHSLHTPGDATYRTQLVLGLNGALNLPALRRAWQHVVAAHPLLRSCFFWEGLSAPVQVVLRQAALPWSERDLRGVPDPARELARITAEAAAQPLALDEAPVLRVTLVRTAEQSYELLFDSHHILLDGWSLGIILRDVVDGYARAAADEPMPVLAAGAYERYLRWLRAQDRVRAAEFWRGRLQDLESPTPLGVDRRQPGSPRGHRVHTIQLSPELTARVGALAEAERITVATFFEGVWALLLSRYSGQDDVVFGTVSSGRDAEVPGLQEIVGFFLRTLPLRVKVDGRLELGSWLRALQAAQVEARAHQQLSLVELQRLSQVPVATPLFESMMVFENFPVDERLFRGSGLRFTYRSAATPTHYPLVVSATPGEQLSVSFDYDLALFDGPTIERMAGHFEQLVRGMVRERAPRLAELSPLTPQEVRLLTQDWNRTEEDLGADLCLHELFERQAAEHADQVALVDLCGPSPRRLSYAELNERANHLAQRLVERGAGPEQLVGLFLPRGAELVIALLAVHKAGAAFVVLDPELPAGRLSMLLKDTRVPLLIGSGSLPATLIGEGAERIDLDALGAGRAGQGPRSEVRPHNLAYVLFTSGTTGQPNGALIEHRGLVNSIRAHISLMRTGPGTRHAHLLSFNFDGALAHLYVMLCAGGTSFLLPREGSYQGEDLLDLMQAERISHALIPPALLAALAPRDLPDLQTLVVAGERCPAELVHRWAPGRRMLNLYGPTEVSILATAAECRPEPREPAIGRPIANLQAYVVDRWGQLAVPGAVGELWLAGVGVGRGYLGRHELTQRKFGPNPFGAGRVYRTGDRVRYRLGDKDPPELEFVGRTDEQVKIRGYRVELAEIEAALRRCQGVQQAVVQLRLRPGTAGGQILVAYLTPAAQPLASADSLAATVRQELAETLPVYMVPSAFVVLPALPLTINGKVDVRALPLPESMKDAPHEETEPRTDTERKLAAIWGAILGLPRVGIHDNFFELGGDSIVSIQVVSRAHAQGLALRARQLFEHPTIARLAAAVAGQHHRAEDQGVVTGAVPLTPIQQWFFGHDRPEPHHFNQAVMLETPPALDAGCLRAALRQLLVHHDALRLRFTRQGASWVQECREPGQDFALEEEDLSALPDDAQGAAIGQAAVRAQRSLDITAGPLMRVVLFRLGAQRRGRLLWVIHHLAVDAVSWRILLPDLAQAYHQAAAGEPIVLAAKTTSFKRWSERLREYAAGTSFDEERAALAGPLPLPVPVDHPGQPNLRADASELRVRLDREATERLTREALRPYNLGVQDLLLTAVAQTLGRWTERSEVWIDLEGHGREELIEDVDLSRTVGWFTSLFPVRLALPGGEPRASLIAIKEQLRAVPRRGIGYGLLRYLREDGAGLRWPKPEVSFNYLGQIDGGPAIPGDFRPVPEYAGPMDAAAGTRTHVLELNAMLTGGCLELAIGYSRELHDTATIEALAGQLLAALTALCEHCVGPRAGAWTPSDFPLVRLQQEELRILADHLGDERRRRVEAIYPLISVQQEILDETLRSPWPGMYMTQVWLIFRGTLDVSALQRAWEHVVDRHPLLRSCFAWQGLSSAVQVVLRGATVPWAEHDWRFVADAEAGLARLGGELALADLPLDAAPLIRLTLVRTGEDHCTLIYDNHHALTDGWSLGVILRDLFEAYRALREEQPLPGDPSDAAGAYEEYLRFLQKEDRARSLRYWQDTLDGFGAPTPLPGERSDRGPEHRPGRYEFRLDAALTARLYALAEAACVTPAALIDGAWALLLGRSSGLRDVLFGMVVSGRDVPVAGVEDLVGHFIYSLPLRVHLDEERDLRSWLQALHAARAEAREHQHVTLPELRSAAGAAPGSPLFRSMVVFENYPLDVSLFQSTELAVSLKLGAGNFNHYTMVLAVQPEGDSLNGFLTYESARFSVESIRELTVQLQALLVAMTTTPVPRLDSLLKSPGTRYLASARPQQGPGAAENSASSR